jgi:hypothetical protein
MAVAIPVITIGILYIRLMGMGESIKRIGILSLVYLLTSAVFVVILWPYLWANPFGHFLEAFEYISRHPHSAALIFQGKEFLTNELPWYYLISWVGISTPLLYLFLFSIGCISSTRKILVSKLNLFQNQEQLLDFIFLGLFFGPILAITVTHTSIYNGWRHLYFIYPFFILIAIGGFLKIWQLTGSYKLGKILLIAALSLNFLFIGHWMYKVHPLQNIYFNLFAGKNWNASYEVDYWGLANRLALRNILDSDNSKFITIWPGSNSKFKSGEPTVFSDQLMLETPENRSRVSSPENIEDSKYVIASNKANYSSEYLSQHGTFKKIGAVKVDGIEILATFMQQNINEIPLPIRGEIISFSKNSLGIFYLYGDRKPPINWELWNSKEWQSPEIWGTWSKGKTTFLKIPLPNEELSKLIIRVRGFITKKNPLQTAELWINGNKLDSLNITSNQGQDFIVNLPRNINSNKDILIEFKNLNPTSPKEAGLSQDNRKIAIGIESIQFQ